MGHALTTERLVLRPVTAHDHAWLLAHWTAPEVRRFLFDSVHLSPAEITAVIEDSARTFAAAGYGLWLIRETAATADTVSAMAAATAVAAISLCGTEALLPLRLTPATPPPGGKFSSATCASRVGITQLG